MILAGVSACKATALGGVNGNNMQAQFLLETSRVYRVAF